jgi:hypothetical protein
MRDVTNACSAVCIIATALAICSVESRAQSNDLPMVRFEKGDGRLRIRIGDEAFADYVFTDPAISRPYFSNVHAPGGVQATRNQPPRAGEDLMDHPTFHPGIWLAFGDLSGADTWRLKARVDHDAELAAPVGEVGRGAFQMRFAYRNPEQPEATMCREDFRCEIRVMEGGYLVMWDSTFTSRREFSFGDQEEMGLGLRVATPLRAQRQAEAGVAGGTGEIVDAEGRKNEKEVWGNSADWCDYSGVVDGRRAGMTIFCHPGNFRPSWFHARDRGLLTANPFGRAAFDKGPPSQLVVRPGNQLRLRFGVLVHSGPQDGRPDLTGAYREYLDLAGL